MTADSFNPLTEEEVKAGRDLDALVAEKVMGFSPVEWSGDFLVYGDQATGGIVPRYSTSIAAAWEVVEKLAPHYIQQAFSRNEIGWEIDWCVSEEAYRKGYRTVVDYAEDYKTQSLPLAICQASLRAVRGEK